MSKILNDFIVASRLQSFLVHMVGRLVRSRIIKGFNLTELAVVTVVASALLGAGFLAISSLRDKQTAETSRLKLLFRASELKKQISSDIQSAILNNSFTAAHNITEEYLQDSTAQKYFGLGTSLKSNTGSGLEVFEIQIFKPFNQFFSVPAKLQEGSSLQIINYSTMTDAQAKSYWRRAMSRAQFFVIGNDRNTLLFPKGETDTTTGIISPLSDGSLNSISFEGRAASFSGANILRTVELVKIRFDRGTKTLTRTGHSKDNPNATAILAEGVRSFRAGYTFRRKDPNDLVNLNNLPTLNLSAENLPNSLPEAWTVTQCTSEDQSPIDQNGQIIPSCVKPRNIKDVYIQIQMEVEGPQKLLQTQNLDHEGMNIRLNQDSNSSSQLIATIDFKVAPKNFSETIASVAAGQQLACEPTPANRCYPQCSSVFTSLDPNSNAWIGYGRYVGHPLGASSYCQCWTNPADASQVSQQNWNDIGGWVTTNSAERLRIEACGRAYGCHWGVMNKHPGYRLACGCLRTANSPNQDNHFVLRTIDNRPQFTSSNSAESGGHILRNLNWDTDPYLLSIKNDGYLSSALRCDQYGGWNPCWLALERYFDHLGGSAGARPTQDPFKARCQCLANKDIPFSCDTKAIANGEAPSAQCLTEQGADLDLQNMDYNLICNKAARSPGGVIACPHTYKIPGATMPAQTSFIAPSNFQAPESVQNFYHLFTNETFEGKLGISEKAADLCECLVQRGQLLKNEPNSALSLQPLNWNSLNLKRVDFRAANSAPPSYSDLTYLTEGSNQEQQTPGYATATLNSNHQAIWGSRQESPDRLCGRVFCDNTNNYNSVHCCTKRNTTAESQLAPQYQAWSGYCNETCVAWTPDTDPLEININKVRRHITGTPANQPLPSYCGGPASQTGTPSN